MKLPDFLQDPQMNALRQKMCANELGDFQLFDPQKQLTYSEREALEEGRLQPASNDLRILKDKTLAYKNSRLWLTHDGSYHLAYCPQVQSLRHHHQLIFCGTENNSEDELCLECLAILKYQGLDSRRIRRNEYMEQIQEEFNLADFKKEYPFYPV